MPEWIWAIVIGVVVFGLVGTIWYTHEFHDQERNRHLWDQIGRDSDSGMRKTVHDTANECLANRGDIRDLERRVTRLEDDV